MAKDLPSYLPTKKQIAAATAEIRRGWNNRQRMRATVYVPVRWQVPEVEYRGPVPDDKPE